MSSVDTHDFVDETYGAQFRVQQVPVPVSGEQRRIKPGRQTVLEAPAIHNGIGLNKVVLEQIMQ